MEQKSAELKKLFDEKRYSEIIDIIQSKISEKDKNSGLLNLLGVCKLLNNRNEDSIKSSINDFRKSYLKEKNTENAYRALKNFINASVDLFDIEFRSKGKILSENIFKEIFLYLDGNKDYFEKNEGHANSIVRVSKRYLDLDKIIYYLNIIVNLNENNADALCSLIYFNSFKKDWDQEKFLKYTRLLNKRLPLYSIDKLEKIKSEKNGKSINLAFLSSDLRSKHSVTYFLKAVLQGYEKKKFNIFLYLNNQKEDETTDEFKNLVYKSKNISHLSDKEAINAIRSDKIDIIIDLMGITSNHRLALFKNRLAKKQLIWCGYCNTTGINEMDYLISDKNLILQNEEKLYSEKILYMENIWKCHVGYEGERQFYDAPMIKNKYITFGSFNNFRKINDNVIDVWSSILKKIDNSKLILKASDTASVTKISKEFEKKGVLKMVEFKLHTTNLDDHLNQYKNIDLALDTFPYNGVTTSFEAIWMGVPVLTMKGFNFNSRCGESINKNLDLEELIAVNEKDYVEKAISLTENDKILNLRKFVFNNCLKSPLFNKNKFSKQFFSSLEKIYNQ